MNYAFGVRNRGMHTMRTWAQYPMNQVYRGARRPHTLMRRRPPPRYWLMRVFAF